MKQSNAELAARIMLGDLTIDDVPEARQRNVGWMVERFSPPEPPGSPIDLLEWLMSELDRARAGR